MPRTLSQPELDRELSVRDLTDPSAGPHAVQQVIDAATTALVRRWGCELRLRRGEPVVPVADNYDRLGYSAGDVTRNERYTRYLEEGLMLRSHSSAIIPPTLDELARDEAAGSAPSDVLLACPGICYRRDSIDWQHTSRPHQVDLWRLARRPLGTGDLDDMVGALCGALVPGRRYRVEARVHPYTNDGLQVDVEWGGEWVEIAECGLADPRLLRASGLEAPWSGLALGMGLDRLVMLMKGVPDVRLLRAADPRIAAQMEDLLAYRPVSLMPCVKRDLSIAVDATDEAEDLGDRVRSALGERSEVVEEVRVLSRALPRDLPSRARDRLGILPGQVNLLVRLTLCALDRSLGDQEANEIRDVVYLALHRGTARMLAAQP